MQIPSARLSTRFDNELAINLALSINSILQDIVTTFSLSSLSIFVASISIGIEKVVHFSVFLPRHSNCRANSFINSFITKW